VLIDGAYLVLKDAPYREPADLDQPGKRIAVGENSVYDLYLTRTLKNAKLMRTAGRCCKNIELFLTEKLDAAAGVRQPLNAYAKDHPDVRVMEKPFQQIRQAMGTPKGRTAAAAYLRSFIEEMKADGFVADALKRSNQPDAQVAPAGG
jgi:polar amino acid transport system substrate-binding protein